MCSFFSFHTIKWYAINVCNCLQWVSPFYFGLSWDFLCFVLVWIYNERRIQTWQRHLSTVWTLCNSQKTYCIRKYFCQLAKLLSRMIKKRKLKKCAVEVQDQRVFFLKKKNRKKERNLTAADNVEYTCYRWGDESTKVKTYGHLPLAVHLLLHAAFE